MTESIQRRVEALESRSSAGNGSLRVVFAMVGETAAEARLREKVESDERVIVVTFLSKVLPQVSPIPVDVGSAGNHLGSLKARRR